MTLTEIKTAALGNVIRIHGNQEDIQQKQTEVIDVNINTNLTVSNSKGSKIVQKLFFVLVIFLTVTFAILHVNVRSEIQALKSQEQSIKSKIASLMNKYEQMSNQFSHFRSHHRYYQPLTTSDEYEGDAVTSASTSKDETVDRYDKLSKTSRLNTFQSDKANSILGRGSQENSSFVESDDFKGGKNDSKVNFINDEKENNGNRFTRTILNTTDENYQALISPVQENFTNAGPNSNWNEHDDKMINDQENDNSSETLSKPRTSRMRRDDERRGKIRTKNKRPPNRSRRRLGPLVATFTGGIPNQHITDRGAIGPWVKLAKNTSHYDLQKFHLVDDRKAIEVTMNGLYMISAQIFYFGQQTNYSYWILLSSEGQSKSQKIIKCSAVSSAGANEVSCHTNFVLSLRRGDRLHIQQQERDRLIDLREGHSYIQLVLLSNESQKRD